MLTNFPKYFSTRAIFAYLAALAIVSMVYMSYALPFQFMLFGLAAILLFFVYSNKLTMKWQGLSPMTFRKKLFVTALVIRLVYVIFIYFYCMAITGRPYMFHPADELQYHNLAVRWSEFGFEEFQHLMKTYIALSDSGYYWLLGFQYLLMGTNVLPPRLLKCVIDAFSCVLLYNLGKRNFGESAGRMTGVFCMLMPTMWYYCGTTLKETAMTFMLILFVERADWALRAPKISIRELILPFLMVLVMFTFRTALAGVMVAALVAAMILSSGKQLQMWKKILYGSIFAIWMTLTVGTEIIQETQQLWEGRMENQELGYAERATRGNSFAQYATASVFAPLIFTIPFASMVTIPDQEIQMMLNGAYFAKNVMSGLTIFALFLLLFRKQWRQHVLPLAVMCGYLLVLVFSNFAHSGRFHFPVIGLELMFAAYGVSQLTNRQKRWYVIWLVGVVIANVVWAWIKLAGRGWV